MPAAKVRERSYRTFAGTNIAVQSRTPKRGLNRAEYKGLTARGSLSFLRPYLLPNIKQYDR